ncbi:hypothetical protein [Aulosira sp. FACHB-615]|uniref:hypothetical protein n=1 Tax=Aulosira sp. FACHB-615 TaxID=2692777 RepID=UPI0018F03849|nr:hypothetical protein [Aulosira sp. FACHB-615]
MPILSSTPMVLAILEERKTQTRRIVKPQPHFPTVAADGQAGIYGIKLKPDGTCFYRTNGDGDSIKLKSPYGYKGDRLWVRETWRPALSDTHECFAYKADNMYQCGKQVPEGCNMAWKPSIHMPKKACRLWLEVANVRVERLQDISEEDAIAEGVLFEDGLYWDYLNNEYQYKSAIASYESLWMSIHGAESFLKNVWVWVVEFRRVG